MEMNFDRLGLSLCCNWERAIFLFALVLQNILTFGQTKVLDGSFDSSVRDLPSIEKVTTITSDSLFTILTSKEEISGEDILVTMIELLIDSTVTTEETKDKRTLIVETNKNTGEVLRVIVREGRYRNDLRYYESKFRYNIKFDSLKAADTDFGWYGWE